MDFMDSKLGQSILNFDCYLMQKKPSMSDSIHLFHFWLLRPRLWFLQVKGVLEMSLEEVLPRPQSGLLNRLLRLAKAETLLENNQTVFLLKPGKEYMVSGSHRMKSSLLLIESEEFQDQITSSFEVQSSLSLNSRIWESRLDEKHLAS